MTYEELVSTYGDDLFGLAMLYGSGNYWQGILWLETESAETEDPSGGASTLAAVQSGQLVTLVSSLNASTLAAAQSGQVAAFASAVNWTPASAGANLKMALDSVTLSGSDVLTYVDSSGNGRTVTWPVDHRPIYSATGGPNSIPSIHFDYELFQAGALPDNCLDALTGGAHIWAIVRSENTAHEGLWTLEGTPSGADATYWPYDGDGCIYDGSGSDTRRSSASMAGALSSWHIVEIVSTATSWDLLINGVNKIHSATNTVAWPAAPRIGGGAAGGFDGDIAGAWMFGDSTERASMAAYLTALTGIAIA